MWGCTAPKHLCCYPRGGRVDSSYDKNKQMNKQKTGGSIREDRSLEKQSDPETNENSWAWFQKKPANGEWELLLAFGNLLIFTDHVALTDCCLTLNIFKAEELFCQFLYDNYRNTSFNWKSFNGITLLGIQIAKCLLCYSMCNRSYTTCFFSEKRIKVK